MASSYSEPVTAFAQLSSQSNAVAANSNPASSTGVSQSSSQSAKDQLQTPKSPRKHSADAALFEVALPCCHCISIYSISVCSLKSQQINFPLL